MARTALAPDALAAALADLPGWAGDSNGIRREFRFGSYEAGVAFAVRVALHRSLKALADTYQEKTP